MPKTLNVALVYGGRSVEHDVSVISATNIEKYSDATRFNIIPIGISKVGKWYRTNGVVKDIEGGDPLTLALDAKNPHFSANGNSFALDVAFIILHGTDGEDGSIQGLFTTMNIPFVGSDTHGSALAMNKITAKKMLLQAGIPTARCLFMYKNQVQLPYSEVEKVLSSPVIVKPANLGSSVGVSKVRNEEEFKAAIALAFQFDSSLLIEEFITGRELECAVLGNENAEASPAGEVELSTDYEFYDFDAKYVDGNASTLHIPAEIDSTINERIKLLSLQAYRALDCKDLSRIDLFLKPDNEVIVNEINTLPGFTNISMYPKLCELMGVQYTELITRLIQMAVERNVDRNARETTFLSGLS